MIECEKKYIVQSGDWKKHIIGKEVIKQSYFLENNIKKRIRIVDDHQAIITIKGETSILDGFLLRDEDEHTIPIEKGVELLAKEHIVKERYTLDVGVTILNKFYPITLDNFLNLDTELIVAELEIPRTMLSYLSDKELNTLPSWLVDVTTEDKHATYSNNNLIKRLKVK